MATAYIASVEEELTCCVCLELFFDPHTPKDLDCPHVICSMCIRSMVEGGRPVIVCPECRVKTPLPKEGVAAMKTNLRLRNLAEKHQKYVEKKKLLDSQQTRQCSKKMLMCPDHLDREMDLICVTCDVTVCHACALLSHKGHRHKVRNVMKLYKQHMMEIKSILTKLFEDAEQCEKISQDLDETARKVAASVTTAEKKIDEAAALVIDDVTRQSKALKLELKAKTDFKMKECRQHKVTLQRVDLDLMELIAEVLNTVDTTPCYEYLSQHKRLTDKLKTTVVPEELGNIECNADDVVFKEERSTVKLGTIGKFNRKGMVRKLQVFTELTSFSSPLLDVAFGKTDGTLAVSKEGCNNVLIYCKNPCGYYERTSYLKVTGMKEIPCYVTIAADGRFLVAKNKCIRVYSSSCEFEKAIYTKPRGVEGPKSQLNCITKAADSKIIVGYCSEPVLTVHTFAGDLVKTITVPDNPLYLTTVGDAQIAMLYGEGVSLIDIESGNKRTCINLEEKCLFGTICYDKETDSMLVSADGEIEQYCLTTDKLPELIAPNVGNICAMSITEDGMLACADYSGRITLYKLLF